jgi:hypothetical protein
MIMMMMMIRTMIMMTTTAVVSLIEKGDYKKKFWEELVKVKVALPADL